MGWAHPEGSRARPLLLHGVGVQLVERTTEPTTDRRALRCWTPWLTQVLTPGRLASEFGLSPAATTALVDRLVAADPVERVRDLPDRRQARLHLTTTAQRFGEELLLPWARRIASAVAQLSPHDASAVSRFLGEVLADEAD